MLVLQADVANASEVRAALAKTHSQFGKLHGVIHGAGNVTADGFFGVDEASPELCELQFRAKVRGVIQLERALRTESLDFVVLLSSVSSVLGGIGYVGYAAGNIFMDQFARKYGEKTGVPWVSVDWDTWNFEADGDTGSNHLSLLPDEGIEVFRQILSSASSPQIVVSVGDLTERIEQWINPRRLQNAHRVYEGQSGLHTDVRYVAPRNPIEKAVADLWQDTLGIPRVGIYDNFFQDLSGSSLLATQIASQLRSKYRVGLPLRQFFEGPTVAELANVISLQCQASNESVSLVG